ncbi:hypothetical protein BU15DRAFT_61942 [Melanogaster broomeanus]|nr:hypothetical protein BU15DRAFT_61942 [Melanogaster broomeanus]
MSKSRSQSQSSRIPSAIKQEQEQALEDIKPKPEDLDDAQVPPETPSVKAEPSPPPQLKRETSESSASAPPAADVKPKRKGPQLIGDLPRAEEAARATFIELPDNHYQYNTLGRSREALESMTCDCAYEHGVDDPTDACGHGSDCINRLTQVECLPEDCRCRSYCQNQRFQRKDYAKLEVVLTEKKGYGLRAGSDIPKDSFIYEYVGDVVSHPSFMKRMREYAEEGVKHFYFMMLQKDEYIDATKRGGIGRFANHSCNPNCYVAKWQVGERVRMGIFANRSVRKDEELTFNYNVDRYGHDPQPCYCGEENCVGFLGGKTQTDIGGMDDLYLDALGITDEVEKFGLKGSKKKKAKELDGDYMPELKPLLKEGVTTVVRAIRQTSNKKLLCKLLTRIKITDDEAALRQILRLRGFSLMTNILQDHAKDVEVTILALEAMVKWPLIQRNKVDDSKIRVPVQVCVESENETMKSLALKLLEYWDSLEVAYRIPKRLKANGEEEPLDTPSIIIIDSHDDNRPLKKTRWESDDVQFKLAAPRPTPLPRPTTPPPQPPNVQNVDYPQGTVDVIRQRQAKQKEIAHIIAAANAAAEAEAARLAAAAAAAAAAPAPETVKRKSKPPRKQQTKEDKEANKEKRLLKLVGAVVVKCMSRYSGKMEADMFKKYAKEEKKSSSYQEGRLDALSDEKVVKIQKVLQRIHRQAPLSTRRHITKTGIGIDDGHDPSGSAHTPDAHGNGEDADGEGGEDADADVEMVMSVEQAMDLGSDSEDGDQDQEHDANGDAEMEGAGDLHSSDEMDHDPSPMEGVSSHVHPPASVSVTPLTPPQSHELGKSDPRVEHRGDEPGWEPDGIEAANGLNEVHA